MVNKNKYYFEMGIKFATDFDVNQLENILGLKASKLVNFSEAKGPVKTAKFYYTTAEFDEIYTDEEFEKFLKSILGHLYPLPQILSENDGEISFCIVFTQIDEKPCISLSSETIQILATLGASFDIDYA